MKTALIVDDWVGLRDQLAHTIQVSLKGWRAITASDVKGAESLYRENEIHLAVLDMALPESKTGGFEMYTRWRADGATFPIVLMSAGHVDKLWDAKDAGADDVIVKPFHPRQFMSRINDVLRRHEQAAQYANGGARVDGIRLGDSFEFGGATITQDMEIRFPSGEVVRLRPKDYGILRFFSERRGALATKEEVIKSVWGRDARVDTNSIYNYIGSLRKLYSAHGADFDLMVQASAKAGWRISP